jgi:hypothetical protein
MRDAAKKGRLASNLPGPLFGAANGNTKLTPELVTEIYLSKETGDKIGARLGVSQGSVSLIRLGKVWRSVTQDLPAPSTIRGKRQ